MKCPKCGYEPPKDELPIEYAFAVLAFALLMFIMCLINEILKGAGII